MTAETAETPRTSEPAAEPTHRGRVVDGVDVLGALSPSRAADFTSCPLLYRFRTVDRLPEPSSAAAVRGTLVHRVLEELFDLPSPRRTPEQAEQMLEPAWEQLLTDEPDLGLIFQDDDPAAWLASCQQALRTYFDLEDPRLLEPAERELYVESLLASKLLLRGIVDRLDVASDGSIRVVDYKTGRAPGEGFEHTALFQLRFYALVIWRTRGVVPRLLQLVYLGSGHLITYQPDKADLLATERKVEAVWRAISYAQQSGDWQPQRSRRCGWCAHQALCPAWGGTPPPLPPAESPSSVPGRPPFGARVG